MAQPLHNYDHSDDGLGVIWSASGSKSVWDEMAHALQ